MTPSSWPPIRRIPGIILQESGEPHVFHTYSSTIYRAWRLPEKKRSHSFFSTIQRLFETRVYLSITHGRVEEKSLHWGQRLLRRLGIRYGDTTFSKNDKEQLDLIKNNRKMLIRAIKYINSYFQNMTLGGEDFSSLPTAAQKRQAKEEVMKTLSNTNYSAEEKIAIFEKAWQERELNK